jgi:hypothetical protein
MDGPAVQAIVDSFYSGKLSLSCTTVSSVIVTANQLAVDAAEKAACDFLVESLETSTACEALEFADFHRTCGVHASRLLVQCREYVVDHFAECSVQPSFVELPGLVVAELIASDDLPVEEVEVLDAVRVWLNHKATIPSAGDDIDGTKLLALVRWPLLPLHVQLGLPDEPLLRRMMLTNDAACRLGLQLLNECSGEFGDSDAAAACPRLKPRKGSKVDRVPPLGFTAMSERHYAVGRGGALLLVTENPYDRPALCHKRVMNRGLSCAEFTFDTVDAIKSDDDEFSIGVARPKIDVKAPNTEESEEFWGISSRDGMLYNNNWPSGWEGKQGYKTGDVLRLLLDSDVGRLTVKKNGVLLGVAVSTGLTGDVCWAVSALFSEMDFGGTRANPWVHIEEVDAAEF